MPTWAEVIAGALHRRIGGWFCWPFWNREEEVNVSAFRSGFAEPEVRGLSFRAVRGPEDARALHAVHIGRIARDRVDVTLHHEDLPSLDGLYADLAQSVATGEQDRWLIAQVGEGAAGYSQVASWCEEDGVSVHFIGGWVLPEWRGRGIGTAMLRWGEALARRLAAAQHSRRRVEFAANASCTEHDATALLRNEGYHVAFTTLEMRHDISARVPAAPPLPAGLELRPVLPEHHPELIASIIECYQDAFPGNRYRTDFDRVAYFTAELRKPKHDPRFWYVAWDGDEIAGQVLLTSEKGEVYVDQVSVRPPWRRRGLARALLVRALRDVRERGATVIWTDTFAEYQTRAVDLYLSLGFSVVKEFPRYRKPGD